MTVAEAFARQAGYKHGRPIPDGEDAPGALPRIHAGAQATPLVLRGVAARWPALARWDREYLLARHGEARVRPSVGLPEHGVPYREPEAAFRRELTLRAFWDELAVRGRCYVDQQPLAGLPGLADDVPIGALLGSRPYSELNLWIGRGTRSGLHVDTASNFVVMVRGEKRCVLFAPPEAPRLYPFPDSITKSQVDAEAPDLARFPRVAGAEPWVTTITAGDALYLPPGWWHHLSSPMSDYHISLNCWFGKDDPLALYGSLLWQLGPRYGARVAADFARHGLLGRPFVRRNYRPLPDGVKLYEVLRAAARARLTALVGGR